MLRNIKINDIPDLTKICHHGMQLDEFNDHLVKEKTLEAADFFPELAIIEQSDTINGFVQGALGKRNNLTHGWIRLLVVHPKARRNRIGSLLLNELEKRLKLKGAKFITTMDCPSNYLTPGIDWRYNETYGFLEKNGYRRIHTNLNLICSLTPQKFNLDAEINRLQNDGLVIRRAKQNDNLLVDEFLLNHFPEWQAEVHHCFKNSPISLYISLRNNKIIAFSAYQGNNKSLPWFGPMAVLPQNRNKGIGAVLCNLCLRDLAMQGYKHSIIPWVGPVRFYSKVCNANLHRIFWVWEKKL